MSRRNSDRIAPVPRFRAMAAYGIAMLALSLFAGLSFAAPDEGPTGGPAEVDTEQVAAPKATSPLQIELQAALDREIEELAALQLRYDNARGPLEALEVQQEIDTLKQASELSILTIQAKHARLAGKTEAADEIERLVAEMAARSGIEVTSSESSSDR